MDNSPDHVIDKYLVEYLVGNGGRLVRCYGKFRAVPTGWNGRGGKLRWKWLLVSVVMLNLKSVSGVPIHVHTGQMAPKTNTGKTWPRSQSNHGEAEFVLDSRCLLLHWRKIRSWIKGLRAIPISTDSNFKRFCIPFPSLKFVTVYKSSDVKSFSWNHRFHFYW